MNLNDEQLFIYQRGGDKEEWKKVFYLIQSLDSLPDDIDIDYTPFSKKLTLHIDYYERSKEVETAFRELKTNLYRVMEFHENAMVVTFVEHFK